jgi:HEPN domain-containing protein
MDNENIDIDIEKIVKHWVDTSDDDYKTMLTLYDSNSFGWALFLGHISTEKLLKAYYVKKHKKHSPFLHNL